MILDVRRKALVVDDQRLGQKMLAMLLSDMGMEVTIANDGKEAVDQFDGTQDFIFMDFYMPQVNGDQATKAIRKKEQKLGKEKTTYIIGMTANNVEEIKQSCIDSGMNEVVPRPIKYELVEELLKKYSKN